ncbi:MAG: glycosyltransferase [Anaerolineaceae bacterium]|nr:glycosyltransferase [Anaerolineaceae bacterium]
MKIACIATSQVPSNTANSIQVMKACDALQQAGEEVCLWVPGEGSTDAVDQTNLYGLKTRFEVHQLTSYKTLRRYDFAWRALRAARTWNANLIYTWFLPDAVLGLWAGLPVILELHDLPTGKAGPWWFRQFAKAAGKKRLLVITAALQKGLEDDYNIRFTPHQVQVAPNGVDWQDYQDLPDAEQARQQLGLVQQPTAVYTGHFYAGRGMDLLFGLAKHLPQVQFLWVGGRKQDVDGWQARLQEEGVANVILTGFVDKRDLPLYQATADFLLMPYERAVAGSSGGNSAAICSPMKMFDYLAAGRVILTSDLPVLREVLNEDNAVFCPAEDVDAWQAALESLLADENRCHKLAQQARLDGQDFSWLERARHALDGFV